MANKFPKRTIKQIKSLNISFGSIYCTVCGKNVREQGSIYAVDSRNDKYCPKCAVELLNKRIEMLNKLKQEVRDKSMLNELEEPETLEDEDE